MLTTGVEITQKSSSLVSIDGRTSRTQEITIAQSYNPMKIME